MDKVFCLIFFAHMSIISEGQITVPPLELKFSYQIEEELAHGKLKSSEAAWHYTYIGDVASALKTTEVMIQWGLDTLMEEFDYEDLVRTSASDYIISQADNHEIIIISEAHHKPYHRIFTKSMLKGLYNKGYRHLGLEARTDQDNLPARLPKDSMMIRGYPLFSRISGSYTREPQMSNMIREAIDIGFKVFGYEPMDRKLERDVGQAQNIAKYIESHPEGKFLIHCGYSHAIESDLKKRGDTGWMAYHLKQLTNKDPLTVYQDIFSEKLVFKENPVYRNLHATEPSIFLNDQRKPFQFFKDFKNFDLLVYHPPSTFINSRPSWIYEEGKIEFMLEDLKENQLPVIIKAIPEKNDPRAVPVDIIEIKHRFDRKPLILLPGSYRIELIYDEGPVEIRKIEVK